MRRNDEVARTEGDRAITFPKLQGKTHFHIHTNMQNLAQELRKQLAMRVSGIQCCPMCAANALLCSVQLLRQVVANPNCSH
jgi:alkylhydroperoxidase family enzyme